MTKKRYKEDDVALDRFGKVLMMLFIVLVAIGVIVVIRLKVIK